MNMYEVPLIKGLTLINIRNLICTQFGYKKSELGSFIYQDSATFRKKANGTRPIQPEDLINLEFNMTHKLCHQNTAEYFRLMKEWFPELRHYNNETDLRAIINANLLGMVSENIHPSPISSPNENISSIRFIQLCLTHNSPISRFRLVAQTGWSWFDNPEKRRLLKRLADMGITIQIIGNPMTSETKKFIQAMRNPKLELDYRGVNHTLAEWHKYESVYNNIQLKISDFYPILRHTQIVDFEDGAKRALISDYAYGSPTDNNPSRRQITSSSNELNYYEKEFDFLWERGKNYEDWIKVQPKPNETMPANEYVLMYPTHHKTVSSLQNWIYCLLTVTNDNKAYMKTNVRDINLISDTPDNYEYYYQGEVRATSKTVNIFLCDLKQEEIITITFSKPIHTMERYIGIISALTPSGNAPIAFKCACFGHSVLPKVNNDLLIILLSNNNKSYNNNLMVLEPQDIDTFYSSRLLND